MAARPKHTATQSSLITEQHRLVHRHHLPGRRYDRNRVARAFNEPLPPLFPADTPRTIPEYPRATVEEVSELNHITHLRSARLRLSMNYTGRQWFSAREKRSDYSLMDRGGTATSDRASS